MTEQPVDPKRHDADDGLQDGLQDGEIPERARPPKRDCVI